MGFGSGIYDSLLEPENRRSGAGESAAMGTDPVLLEMAQAVRDQAADVAALARRQVEDKKAVTRTPHALGRDEEHFVLLARACDQHHVYVPGGARAPILQRAEGRRGGSWVSAT